MQSFTYPSRSRNYFQSHHSQLHPHHVTGVHKCLNILPFTSAANHFVVISERSRLLTIMYVAISAFIRTERIYYSIVTSDSSSATQPRQLCHLHAARNITCVTFRTKRSLNGSLILFTSSIFDQVWHDTQTTPNKKWNWNLSLTTVWTEMRYHSSF